MPNTGSTHRFDPEVQKALSELSKLLHCSKNRLINEAVRPYVQRCSQEIAHTLETTLNALQAYRSPDKDFEKSIEDFVNAEVEFASENPMSS